MEDIIIIDKRIGGETATDKIIEIDKIIEEMTPDKNIERGLRVGIDQEIIVMTVLEVEIEIEAEMDGVVIPLVLRIFIYYQFI